MIFTDYTMKGKSVHVPTLEIKMNAGGEQPEVESTAKPEPVVLIPTSNPVKDMINPRPITLKPKAQPKNNIKFVV
jgi:hypothetical protein